MALFKVLRGTSANLINQPYHDGYAYFTSDDGRFYIDVQLDAKPSYYYSSGLENGKTVYRIEIESKTWAELATTKTDVGHRHTMDEITPIQTKIYTDVIGTENNWANATFFFGSIKPVDWYAIWKIKYRIRTFVPGKNGYNQIAEVMISGDQGELRSYSSMNTVSSYYPAYYHEIYRLKNAGFNNGYGHSLGVRFYSAAEPINTNFKRTIDIQILEVENCTFSFYDNCLKYSQIPGTGSTNYNTYTELNYYSNGLQETGDANDPNYQNKIYYTSRQAVEDLYRYHLVLSTKDKKILPVSSANNDRDGTNRTYTTTPFDPFGEIYYYNSTTTINANGNIGNGTLYRQMLVDLRYSFPFNNTVNYKLVARQPVYLVATMQSDGTAVLTIPSGSMIGPLTQTLPIIEDGLIYIYLGQAYEDTYPYRLELSLQHPIYIYKNGKITEYTNGDGHSHDLNITSSSNTADIALTAATTYELTAGGESIIFKTPADGNTDTKVNVIARGTNKAYLMGDTTAPTGTAAAHTAVAETGIYMTTTTGELNATQYKVNEKAYMHYVTADDAIGFTFI